MSEVFMDGVKDEIMEGRKKRREQEKKNLILKSMYSPKNPKIN